MSLQNNSVTIQKSHWVHWIRLLVDSTNPSIIIYWPYSMVLVIVCGFRKVQNVPLFCSSASPHVPCMFTCFYRTFAELSCLCACFLSLGGGTEKRSKVTKSKDEEWGKIWDNEWEQMVKYKHKHTKETVYVSTPPSFLIWILFLFLLLFV